MKMAKASAADLEMAMELCAALDSLTGRGCCVPAAVEQEDGEPFDRDDREQCARVLGYLLDLANRASLMRVVWGCAVMLDPLNKCVDPVSGVIELHPHAQAGMSAHQALPSSEWNEDIGPVLWWKFPVNEPPYFGTPLDAGWLACHTHWTSQIVPEQPTNDEATNSTCEAAPS